MISMSKLFIMYLVTVDVHELSRWSDHSSESFTQKMTPITTPYRKRFLRRLLSTYEIVTFVHLCTFKRVSFRTRHGHKIKCFINCIFFFATGNQLLSYVSVPYIEKQCPKLKVIRIFVDFVISVIKLIMSLAVNNLMLTGNMTLT